MEHTEMVADHQRNIGLLEEICRFIKSEVAGYSPTGAVCVSPVDRQQRHVNATPAQRFDQPRIWNAITRMIDAQACQLKKVAQEMVLAAVVPPQLLVRRGNDLDLISRRQKYDVSIVDEDCPFAV
jgi:hypothetical protein